MPRKIVALSLMLWLYGCGSVSEEQGADLLLSVMSAEELSSIDELGPADADMYVRVVLRLENDREDAVPLAPQLFRVRTGAGLEVIASAASPLTEDACPPDAFLSAGKSIHCAAIFEIRRDALPTSLIYVGTGDSDGEERIQVEASIDSFQNCDRCDDECTDLSSNEDHCGACDTQIPEDGICRDGEPACPSSLADCGGRCVNLSSNRSHCGECFNSIGEAHCLNGEPDCQLDLVYVEGRCIDLSSDHEHCGAIGNHCDHPSSCVEGLCLFFRSSDERISCDDLCAPQGLCVHADERPWFEYRCPNDQHLALSSSPCNEVPRETRSHMGMDCTLHRVFCACETL